MLRSQGAHLKADGRRAEAVRGNEGMSTGEKRAVGGALAGRVFTTDASWETLCEKSYAQK